MNYLSDSLLNVQANKSRQTYQTEEQVRKGRPASSNVIEIFTRN